MKEVRTWMLLSRLILGTLGRNGVAHRLSYLTGASDERYRRTLLVILGRTASKITSTIVLLLMTPLLLDHLGVEKFGVWLTISSMVTMMAFADLGLGNGIMTGIAAAAGKDDNVQAACIVSNGLMMLCLSGTALLLVGVPLVSTVDWNRVLNISAGWDASTSIRVAVIMFAIGVPVTIIGRIQAGLQKGFVYSMWLAAASLTTLVAIYLCVHWNASFAAVVGVLLGIPLLFNMTQGFWIFYRQESHLRPSFRMLNFYTSTRLLRIGSVYIVLQIAYLATFMADNLIIARLYGPSEVAEYATVARVFALIPTFLSGVYGAFWPAYSEAIARGDLDWVKSAFFRSFVATSALVTFPVLVLILCARPLLQIWLDGAIQPSLVLLGGFGLFTIVTSMGEALSTFLNSAQRLRDLLRIAVPGAILSILVKIVLGNFFGLQAIIWAGAFTYGAFLLVPYAIACRRTILALH